MMTAGESLAARLAARQEVRAAAEAKRRARVRPGQVWHMPKSKLGRTIKITLVSANCWVYYDLIAGSGPDKRKITLDSLLSSYALVPPEPRPLTTDERIQARHLLQVLSEHARAARNAMEPHTGVLMITDASWLDTWEQMTRDLDDFAGQVREGKPAHPYNTGDRSA